MQRKHFMDIIRIMIKSNVHVLWHFGEGVQFPKLEKVHLILCEEMFFEKLSSYLHQCMI